MAQNKTQRMGIVQKSCARSHFHFLSNKIDYPIIYMTIISHKNQKSTYEHLS